MPRCRPTSPGSSAGRAARAWTRWTSASLARLSTCCRCPWAAPRTTTASSARSAAPPSPSWSSRPTSRNTTQNSGLRVATTTPAGAWIASSGTVITAVNSNNNVYAHTTMNNAVHQWGTFGIVTPTGGAIPVPAANQVITITGIEVRLSDAFVSASCSNSRIRAELSWDGGNTWTTPSAQTGNLTTSTQRRLHPRLGVQPRGVAEDRPAMGPRRLPRHQLPRPTHGHQGLLDVHHSHHARPPRGQRDLRHPDDHDQHGRAADDDQRPAQGAGDRRVPMGQTTATTRTAPT